MNLAERTWISATLICLLILSPAAAQAGMTAKEVREFEGYKVEALKGDAVAQAILGVCYSKGLGVLKDDVLAYRWYRLSAEQGYALGQFNLAIRYYNGEGVPRDFVQSVFWYQKAAMQGHADSQFNLALRYYKGEGVAKDEIEAYAFWNLAGVTDAKARHILAMLEKDMTGDQIAAAQRRTKVLQKDIEAKRASK